MLWLFYTYTIIMGPWFYALPLLLVDCKLGYYFTVYLCFYISRYIVDRLRYFLLLYLLYWMKFKLVLQLHRWLCCFQKLRSAQLGHFSGKSWLVVILTSYYDCIGQSEYNKNTWYDRRCICKHDLTSTQYTVQYLPRYTWFFCFKNIVLYLYRLLPISIFFLFYSFTVTILVKLFISENVFSLPEIIYNIIIF